MSDSHLYLNLLDAKAKSELGSQRHVRCEAGEEEDGGWDCRYSTVLYYILYTKLYTIEMVDGFADTGHATPAPPNVKRYPKKTNDFFQSFSCDSFILLLVCMNARLMCKPLQMITITI